MAEQEIKSGAFRLVLQDDDAGTRRCGACSLCCKLLPMQVRSQAAVVDTVTHMIARGVAKPADFAGMMPDFAKPANTACQHQRHGKGCAVYKRRPFACRLWSCRWLVGNDTDELRRPDRSRYVIDVLPDFVKVTADGNEPVNVEVVQIWIDPNDPDAWRRDAALKRYIERQAEKGIAALIRNGNARATAVLAPPLCNDGKWHEVSGPPSREHSAEDLFEGLRACQRVTFG